MARIEEEGTVILKVLCGSRAYGLETPESDYDMHGVFVIPTSRILSIGEKIKDTQWIEGLDQDNTAWEVKHFLEMAVNCNPTVLETLVAPIIETSDLGDELRALFPYVISRKRVYDAFRGYAKNQRTKMFEPVGKEAITRSLKAAIAYLRSLAQGIELLNKGYYDPLVNQELRIYLMQLKTATKVPQGEIVDMASAFEERLTLAYLNSKIPEFPNMEVVNNWLLEVRKECW